MQETLLCFTLCLHLFIAQSFSVDIGAFQYSSAPQNGGRHIKQDNRENLISTPHMSKYVTCKIRNVASSFLER